MRECCNYPWWDFTQLSNEFNAPVMGLERCHEMADLDSLYAQIQKLRPDVETAYKRLETRWQNTYDAFNKLPIPCKISTCVHVEEGSSYDVETHLEWRKYKGTRRFCITHYWYEVAIQEDRENIIPFEEWSTEQKIDFLNHLPSLLKNAESQIKKFLSKIPE